MHTALNRTLISFILLATFDFFYPLSILSNKQSAQMFVFAVHITAGHIKTLQILYRSQTVTSVSKFFSLKMGTSPDTTLSVAHGELTEIKMAFSPIC